MESQSFQPISERVPLLGKRVSVQQNREVLTRGQRSERRLNQGWAPPVLSVILDKQHQHRSSMKIDETTLHTSDNSKSFVYTMLNPRSDTQQAIAFKCFITIVIIADLIAFVVSTEPDLNEYQKEIFYTWEGVTSTVFLLEYIARLVVVIEAPKYREQGPTRGRISYATTTPALIDLLATFPFFLELVTPFSLPTLTYLRAFRLLRILKTSGFADATNSVYRVIYFNRQILYVAFSICIFLVLFTALLMFYLRPKDPELSQQFRSLGSTIYLSTLMLTGQGGPDGDMPWYTKGVVLMTGVFSIGMFAIPASMLTWGFEAEAERMAIMNYARRRKQPDRDNLPESDNWSYSSCDYSSDEEYRKIIAGDDDGVDEDSAARDAFRLADIDGSGNISLAEYLAMSKNQAPAEQGVGVLSIQEITVSLSVMQRQIEENSQKLDRITRLLEEFKNSN